MSLTDDTNISLVLEAERLAARVAALQKLCGAIAERAAPTWGAGGRYFWIKREEYEQLVAAGRGAAVEP